MFAKSKSNHTERLVHLTAIEALENRAYLSVDLTDAVSLVVPRSGHIKTGSAVVLSVQVVNGGTTTAAGLLAIDPGISLNADGSSPLAFAEASRRVALKAGAHTTFRFVEKVPFGTTPGTYYGVATVDPNNTFSETNIANNSAVSSNNIIVDPKYPNLVGTWTGTDLVKSGTGKGISFSKTLTITSEDPATGKFAFTGTDHIVFSNYPLQGQGTITPAGTFTWASTSIPVNSTGTTHAHGKLVGNTLTFSFSNKIAAGTGSLTLAG